MINMVFVLSLSLFFAFVRLSCLIFYLVNHGF